MNELINKDTITSLELLEQINIFRRQEERGKLRHTELLRTIRDEFEEEITERKIASSKYKDKSGKMNTMFILTLQQAKQVLVRESKYVRKSIIHYIEELEKQLKSQIPQLSREQKAILNVVQSNTQEERMTALIEYKNAVTQPLLNTIEEQKPKVEIFNTRMNEVDNLSITDLTKSFNLKRGQITNWAKDKGYLHKSLVEVNKKGDQYFKVSKHENFKRIVITKDGVDLISQNLDLIRIY